jgi:hypothetical protein
MYRYRTTDGRANLRDRFLLQARTKYLRGAVIVIALALTVGVGFDVRRNVAGFCYSQGRYLSDADMIRQAILYSLQKPPHERVSSPDIIQYGSAEEFMGRNQDCCVVHRQDRGDLENILDGRWVRIFGWYILVVDLWYQYKEAGPNNFYEVSIAMNSCGEFACRAVSMGSRPRVATGNEGGRIKPTQ